MLAVPQAFEDFVGRKNKIARSKQSRDIKKDLEWKKCIPFLISTAGLRMKETRSRKESERERYVSNKKKQCVRTILVTYLVGKSVIKNA